MSVIDTLNDQIRSIQNKIQEFREDLKKKVEALGNLGDLLQNIGTGSGKIDQWKDTIIQNNKTASNNLSEPGVLFGEYHMKKINQIMNDGNVSGAKEDLNSFSKSVQSIIKEVEEQIEKIKDWIKSCEDSVKSIGNQIQNLINKD